jgi:hypothetical protein
MSRSGFVANWVILITPDLIVSEVSAPKRIAPPNSVKIAIEHACHSVRDLDPTEVAKELATYRLAEGLTSLAPLP